METIFNNFYIYVYTYVKINAIKFEESFINLFICLKNLIASSFIKNYIVKNKNLLKRI